MNEVSQETTELVPAVNATPVAAEPAKETAKQADEVPAK